MMPVYHYYHFKMKEIILLILQYLFLTGMISYLFYHSVIPFLILLPGFYFFTKYKKREKIKKRREKLNLSFRDAIMAVGTALKVGYSVENAFREACRDLRLIYGEEEDILLEMQNITRQISNNITIEQLMKDLAKRSGIEDIQNFADIFFIAKRSGGNMSRIIQNTAETISSKIEVQREISTIISAKQYEQKIMNLVPVFIILYVSISSPHFFDSLYHSPAGILIMTGCLAVYLAAFLLAGKITAIEV